MAPKTKEQVKLEHARAHASRIMEVADRIKARLKAHPNDPRAKDLRARLKEYTAQLQEYERLLPTDGA